MSKATARNYEKMKIWMINSEFKMLPVMVSFVSCYCLKN